MPTHRLLATVAVVVAACGRADVTAKVGFYVVAVVAAVAAIEAAVALAAAGEVGVAVGVTSLYLYENLNKPWRVHHPSSFRLFVSEAADQLWVHVQTSLVPVDH